MLQLSAHPAPANPRCCIALGGLDRPGVARSWDGQIFSPLKGASADHLPPQEKSALCSKHIIVPVLNVYENIAPPLSWTVVSQ